MSPFSLREGRQELGRLAGRRSVDSGRGLGGEVRGRRERAKAVPSDVGRLGYPDGGGRVVWIALDKRSWFPMLDAQNIGAQGGPGAGGPIFRLIQAGKVAVLPVGTRVARGQG